MGAGATVALQLLFGLLDRAVAVRNLLSNAQAQGRDITDTEIQTLLAVDDVARKELEAAIQQRRAEEAAKKSVE